MPVNRYYSSVAQETTLTSSASAAAGTITVQELSGWPVQTPFTAVIDPGQPAEEIVNVTAVGGLTLTVERGVDGSTAIDHAAGAVVRHMMTARDLREPQEHMAASLAVHGLEPDSAVVGTNDEQVLTNKTIDASDNDILGLTIEHIAGLQDALDALQDAIAAVAAAKANNSHTHAMTDITGLNAALNGKAASSHTHTQADITGEINATKIGGRRIYVQATNPSSPAPTAGDLLFRKSV